MSTSMIMYLLCAAALGSGIMAGVLFAFSGFIMKAFDQLETQQSIAAMNSINKVILGSAFMPVFFISSIIAVLLSVLAMLNWSDAGSGLILIAGMVYFVGMFVCTAVFNVPLNNSLARVDGEDHHAQHIWSHYLHSWTRWNHVRTLSSLLTSVLCIWVLIYYF